jgi:phosphatidylinositol-4-phosphate 3-kinase
MSLSEGKVHCQFKITRNIQMVCKFLIDSTSFLQILLIVEKSVRNSLYSSSSSIDATKNVEEPDLISFSHEIKNVATTLENPSDPYNKIKESILKLNDSRNQNQQQIVPYNNQQLATQSIYNASCSQQIFPNQYYSQQMYFSSSTPYPRIGFENFALQSNYSAYNYTNINSNQPMPYGISFPRQTIWNSVQQQQHQLQPQTSNLVPAIPALPAATSQIQLTTTAVDSKAPKEMHSSKSSSSDIRYAETSTDNTGNLINLDADDSNIFASILQTFDPLVSNQSQEANSSYYDDQDPFDYIYRGGTQYSDPLYEAVTRSDRSFTSPKTQSKQENPEYYIPSTHSQTQEYSTYDEPPPLPPRNNNNNNNSNGAQDNQRDDNQQIYTNQYSKKLYENVIERRKYDKDLLAFYTMIKELRSKYIYDDDASNIGHIVAAQLDSKYLNVSSIKILVYPSYECFEDPNKYMMASRNRCVENFQKLDGYCPPVIFTCDINSSVIHVIMQCLTMLENEMTGTAESYALKTIGSQEWLSCNSSLSHLEYIHNSIKLEKDVQLGLFPRRDKYMKVIARSYQDDVRDAELKIENILPKDPGSSISYENIIILLETLEMEIDKLESASSTQTVVGLNASGVIQAVKAICALLGAFDTSELYTAINNLKNASDEQFSKLQVCS